MPGAAGRRGWRVCRACSCGGCRSGGEVGPGAGVIYLNPELVLAPPSCIDYVVTHELCHLVHGHHGREFYALLRRAMPDWEERKRRLEREGAETGCQAIPCDGRKRR